MSVLQISAIWNGLVLEFLADRKNHPSLEAAELNSWNHAMKAQLKAEWNPKDRDHFQHVFKGWIDDVNVSCFLLCYWRKDLVILRESFFIDFQSDTMFSPALQMRIIKIERWYLFLWLFMWSFSLIRFHITFLLISPFVLGVCLVYRFVFTRPKVNANCHRLKQVFTRCSSSAKLRIELSTRSILEQVLSTLGDVPIGELIIIEKKCDYGFRLDDP